MIDPQQELFTEVRKRCKEIADTYDTVLPPEGTAYPFIYIGQMRTTEDMRFKQESLADVYIDIHVWHSSPRQRGATSNIMAQVINACFTLRQTAHCSWQYRGAEAQLVTDTSTASPLMHGIVTVQFKLLGGSKND